MSKILLIEDHPDVLEYVSFIIGRMGYEVFNAASRDEALALLETKRPDLLLVDYGMPGMTFEEFARIVKSEYPETRIVLYSAGEAEETAAAFGIKYWASKPFDASKLRVLLADCLCGGTSAMMTSIPDDSITTH